MSLFVNNKKKVLLRAPVLTQSGYGVHARQIAEWLLNRSDIDLEIQALPWGDTPWIIDEKSNGGLIGRIMQKTSDPVGKSYDVSFQLQLPNEWTTNIAKKNIGITAAVETDKCNPEWVSACNAMDCVVFPSKHAENSITSTGKLTTHSIIIPESFSEDFLESNAKSTNVDKLNWETNFNFLVVGQFTGNSPESDRKNIFYTIKWFCETFKDDPDIGLVIKTNTGRNTAIDRKIVKSLLAKLIREVRVGSFPKIHLLHGQMTDAEMASLYRHKQIKALISLTRGEGFGLPILEAGVCGLPIIATGWSGHTEFLKLGKYIEINYKLADVEKSKIDNRIFYPGCRWAQPIEDDAKKKLIKFRNQSSTPVEWAKELSKTLEKNYNMQEICKLYDAVLEEIK